jgi:hypothetical protein
MGRDGLTIAKFYVCEIAGWANDYLLSNRAILHYTPLANSAPLTDRRALVEMDAWLKGGVSGNLTVRRDPDRFCSDHRDAVGHESPVPSLGKDPLCSGKFKS